MDKKKYVENYINLLKIDRGYLNLVQAGTGSGKTKYFLDSDGFSKDIGIKKHRILFVTSRRATLEQQCNRNDKINEYKLKSDRHKYWNNESTQPVDDKILIMTYNKFASILLEKNSVDKNTLENIEAIIFDEIHTLISDRFIKGMDAIQVWLKKTLGIRNKIIIGLSATTSILYSYQNEHGIPFKDLLDEPIINYKAKQLICTEYSTLPYLITNRLEGKTIVLCYSKAQCHSLASKIPDSFVITAPEKIIDIYRINSSKNENARLRLQEERKQVINSNKEIDKVRGYIVENEDLPENINVLITTSTLREGFNIKRESKVNNVVSCLSDELHVIQFSGRVRKSIDNLIVADTYINEDNFNQNGYIQLCRRTFKDFLANRNKTSWFRSIESILQDKDIRNIKTFIFSKNENEFINYINSKHLIRGYLSNEQKSKYAIYRDEQKKEIVSKAIEYKIEDMYPSKMTFKKVVKLMISLGYSIEGIDGEQLNIDGKRTRYRLVIDYIPKEKENDLTNAS